MRASLVFHFAVVAQAYRTHPKGGAACHTDWDCTLGGGCVNGSCVCDAAFTGANCAFFDLLPTPGAAYTVQPVECVVVGGRVNYDPVGTAHV